MIVRCVSIRKDWSSPYILLTKYRTQAQAGPSVSTIRIMVKTGNIQKLEASTTFESFVPLEPPLLETFWTRLELNIDATRVAGRYKAATVVNAFTA